MYNMKLLYMSEKPEKVIKYTYRHRYIGISYIQVFRNLHSIIYLCSTNKQTATYILETVTVTNIYFL